jgi:eukaryotic-like serine/threonine-protein kinase
VQDTLLQTILGERYEILSLLGTGGLSRVYKARHLGMDSLVAIKILNRSIADDEQGAKRFQQEARLVSALDHPNIVKVQSVGIGPDSRPYLVLDYFPGKTLSALLKEQGALSTSSACPIFVQLARAVEHAHAAGILHRDLKPGNVLVSDTESGANSLVMMQPSINL